MQTVYYYISLIGLFAFFLNVFTSNFRGASMKAKSIFEFISGAGFLTFTILLIVLFFHSPWWHPILLFAVVGSIAGMFSPIGKNFIVALLSAIGVIVFNVLSWTTLF